MVGALAAQTPRPSVTKESVNVPPMSRPIEYAMRATSIAYHTVSEVGKEGPRSAQVRRTELAEEVVLHPLGVLAHLRQHLGEALIRVRESLVPVAGHPENPRADHQSEEVQTNDPQQRIRHRVLARESVTNEIDDLHSASMGIP